jgi:hypothetical protein
VVTAPQPAVRGRVEGIVAPATVKVVAHETAFEWPSMPGEAPQTWTAPVAADGSFSFAALPGPRLLRVTGLAGGVAIKRIFLGDADVTDTAFEIKPGEPPPPIRIVLTAETATLSGIVKDASGAPVAGARVVVFSADERLWGTRSRMIHAAETRADGGYEIAGVLPGAYRVVAVSFLESLAWTDASVLRQLSAGTEPVNIAAGKTAMSLVVKR